MCPAPVTLTPDEIAVFRFQNRHSVFVAEFGPLVLLRPEYIHLCLSRFGELVDELVIVVGNGQHIDAVRMLVNECSTLGRMPALRSRALSRLT